MGYCFFIIFNQAILMNTISLRFKRIDQLCVLIIINIHSFSDLLISFVFIVSIYEIYGILHAKYSYRGIIYYQSHIKHWLYHYVTKINDTVLKKNSSWFNTTIAIQTIAFINEQFVFMVAILMTS